jgi:DnaJ homolog subfamily A member 2
MQQAALSSHPDKVAEEERAAAEIKFKAVSKAYEILYDDNKRHLYNTHGMSAFEGGHGNGAGADGDLEEMLQHMFGMGGGMPAGFGNAGPRRPRKGEDEEHPYQVTLEELYKGKSTKFVSKKKVICSHCKGTGGKEKAKPKQCASCQGQGIPAAGTLPEEILTCGSGLKRGLRSVGPGLVAQETVTCSSCKGSGSVYKEKDCCKKCKGDRITEARKTLEVYIPRGSK